MLKGPAEVGVRMVAVPVQWVRLPEATGGVQTNHAEEILLMQPVKNPIHSKMHVHGVVRGVSWAGEG